jgi:hypothetical protein
MFTVSGNGTTFLKGIIATKNPRASARRFLIGGGGDFNRVLGRKNTKAL